MDTKTIFEVILVYSFYLSSVCGTALVLLPLGNRLNRASKLRIRVTGFNFLVVSLLLFPFVLWSL